MIINYMDALLSSSVSRCSIALPFGLRPFHPSAPTPIDIRTTTPNDFPFRFVFFIFILNIIKSIRSLRNLFSVPVLAG